MQEICDQVNGFLDSLLQLIVHDNSVEVSGEGKLVGSLAQTSSKRFFGFGAPVAQPLFQNL